MMNIISSQLLRDLNHINTWTWLIVFAQLDNANTGWPKSNFATSNSYNYENMHIRPHIGKAKMCLTYPSLFSEIVKKQLKIVNKQGVVLGVAWTVLALKRIDIWLFWKWNQPITKFNLDDRHLNDYFAKNL